MKNFLVLFFICMMLVPAGAAEAKTDSARPNILLIVGDDIGFGDLGISGSVTRTPNLDRWRSKAHSSPTSTCRRSAR